MQLSPLQSRLAASLAASLIVFALYLLLSPNLALAAELPQPVDVYLDLQQEHSLQTEPSYEPEFALFGRDVIGDTAADLEPLDNNAPKALNLGPGAVACYVVDKSVLFGSDGSSRAVRSADEESDVGDRILERQEDGSKTLYLSANTCMQPILTGSDTPQLTLYVTNSSDIGCPGGTEDASQIHSRAFEQGAATLSVNATGDIYVSVVAPNISAKYDGMWNFQIVASVDEYYYQYDDGTAELLWMDSDSTSALLLTQNLTTAHNQTDQIMKDGPPYELFVDMQNSTAINGLMRSVCGLTQMAAISANKDGNGRLNNLVTTELTTSGPGGFPKQQFFLDGLNVSSSYTGILVKTPRDSESIVNTKRQAGTRGGGGIVFGPTAFQTTAESACKIVIDLEFCGDIQYAVPGNENKFNGTALAQTYDAYARRMYANFEKAMMQIPCDSDSTSSYSLVKNCKDCMTAYKRWLCTVSMPRCEDIGSSSPYAITRNTGQPFPNGTMLSDAERLQLQQQQPFSNTSRNRFIDAEIQPGPYKEILPCDDICYEVVQSCPAAIGFTCPRSHMVGFNISYGQRDARDPSLVTCNYPGEARTPIGAAGALFPNMALLGLAAWAAALLVW